MSKHVKRMRVFAGPNGSGKSTIIDKIKQNFFTGTYINADDIERGLDYRNYLYFVATESPDINVLRVANRVAKGGHPVPEDKIRERYFRSLDLLADAIPHTYRCFIFDNTGGEYRLFAEIEQASLIHIMDEDLPIWFDRYVINKLT